MAAESEQGKGRRGEKKAKISFGFGRVISPANEKEKVNDSKYFVEVVCLKAQREPHD